MKKHFIIYLLSLLMLSSCEKVIDIDLNSADVALVIEAPLYEGDNPFTVKLSQTTNYFDSKAAPLVSNALITLYNLSDSTQAILENLGNGRYGLQNYTAKSNSTYRLEVSAGGKLYTATSYLPAFVPLDTLSYEFEPASVFGEEGYVIYTEVLDPADQENYYRVLVTLNGKFQDEPENIFLFDDGFTNGNRIKIPLFTQRFAPGDTVKFELQGMDRTTYKYIEAVADLSSGGGQNSTSPANPESNFSGGAFGYFGAYTSSQRTVILPK